MAYTREDVAEIYIATFNRAPDSYGLNYWVNDSGCNDIDEVASSFFDSDEAHVLYPVGTSTQAQVAAAYQNLFNRAPDDDGLNYWIGEIDEGRISQSLMLQALINGAQGDDITIMANKTQVGLTYASSGHDDIESARSVVSGVTSDDTSVADAQSIIAAMPAPTPGFVFTEEWLNGRTLYSIDESDDSDDINDSSDDNYDDDSNDDNDDDSNDDNDDDSNDDNDDDNDDDNYDDNNNDDNNNDDNNNDDDSSNNNYNDDSSDDDNIVELVFNNGEVIASEFGLNGEVTSIERGVYSVDANGVLVLNFNNSETEYMKGVEQISGLNAIVVTWDDDYTYSYSHSEYDDYEYIFLDLPSAEFFIS